MTIFESRLLTCCLEEKEVMTKTNRYDKSPLILEIPDLHAEFFESEGSARAINIRLKIAFMA